MVGEGLLDELPLVDLDVGVFYYRKILNWDPLDRKQNCALAADLIGKTTTLNTSGARISNDEE